jgi:hypothetical protein
MNSRPPQSETGVRQPTAVTINFSDQFQLPKKKVEWTPHGVSLVTKWAFAVGAEVEFAFEHDGKRHCCIGVVVSCRPLERQPGLYSTVLYFTEAPCAELLRAACDCKLAHPRYRSANL